MYIEHPVFEQPADKNGKVWRYMDFTRLLSMIDSRCLFFARADKLGDPFEGSWPRINISARRVVPDGTPEEAHKAFIKSMPNLGGINKQWPKYMAINCWHMNEHESAAMWKLYLQGDEGIAIQSTYNKLRDCFIGEEKIYLGIVKYIDYERESIDAGNVLSAFVHKRISFEHEKEVRALITKWPPRGEKGLDFSQETMDNGTAVKVEIETLIERIYVAPSALDWLAELVKAVVTRYGYQFDVVHSKLNEQPLF